MALTPAEEAQTRELLAQQAAILALAAEEPAIISSLGATDVSLSDLTSASSLGDADLLLVRQGTTDKSIAGSIVKAAGSQPDASETVKGIVEFATPSETASGVSSSLAVHPAGLATSYPSVVGSFSNLKVSATGTSATVTVTADEIVVENVSSAYKTLRGVSLTIAGTSVGANGLDTGSLEISTWYAVYVIWNGTTITGLLSLSATAPTLPSGYTHKARVGWIRTDATANKFPLGFFQRGRRVQYLVAAGSNTPSVPKMAAGIAGNPSTPSWVPVAWDGYAPPTTAAIMLTLHQATASSAVAIAAPNGNYGGYTSVNNPPPLVASGGAQVEQTTYGGIQTESANIYWASYGSTSNGLFVNGWEDNL